MLIKGTHYSWAANCTGRQSTPRPHRRAYSSGWQVHHAEGDWQPGAVSAQIQRSFFDECFDGDIKDPNHIFLHVERDAPGEEVIIAKFRQDVPRALLPDLLQHFPRHRWTGAQEVVLNVALLAAMHNLLEQVLALWAGGEAEGSVSDATAAALATAAAPPFVHRRVAQPHDDGYGSEEEPVATADDQGIVLPWVPDKKEDMPEFNRKIKMSVGKWISTRPSAKIMIMAVVGQPIEKLIRSPAVSLRKEVGRREPSCWGCER